MIKAKLALILWLLLLQDIGATVLGDKAVSMLPGTWAQLTGTNAGLLSSQWSSGGHGYDDGNMAWNSKKRVLMHTAADHGPYVDCSSFPEPPGICWMALMTYTDATNTWAVGGAIPPQVTGFHGYDHVAWDDTNEVMYIRQYNSTQLYRYCVNNSPSWCTGKQGVWSALPLKGSAGQCCGAIAYHPTMDGGTLLFLEGEQGSPGVTGLFAFRESAGTWTTILDSNIGLGGYHNFMECGLRKAVCIFGGGVGNNKKVFRITADKTITAMPDAPFAVDFGPANTRQILEEPVTGNFVAMFGNSATGTSTTAAELWLFNPSGSGSWTQLDSNLKGAGKPCETALNHPCPSDFFSASISTYGVLLFWKFINTSTAEVWLYKYTDDFQQRCQAPGVLRCVGFDSAADIANTQYGANSGIDLGEMVPPSIDTTQKASRASSLKFTIPSNSGSNSSGAYWLNFSDDLTAQIGANGTFYVQWRQRFSPEFISTVYAGGGGWKQSIIGTGDKPGCTVGNTTNCYSSCTALEVVTQNSYHRQFSQMYNSCTGSSSHGAFDGFEEYYPPSDFKLQNNRSSPFCLYSQAQAGTQFPPSGNCFGYVANEWMHFKVKIATGARVNDEWTNSFIELWVGREGQASEKVIQWGPYALTAGPQSEDQKFGKVWLLPYNTGKSAAQSHAPAHTWYDELIISTQDIADPDYSASPIFSHAFSDTLGLTESESNSPTQGGGKGQLNRKVTKKLL